jgi:hypothetical protein
VIAEAAPGGDMIQGEVPAAQDDIPRVHHLHCRPRCKGSTILPRRERKNHNLCCCYCPRTAWGSYFFCIKCQVSFTFSPFSYIIIIS